MKGLGYLISTVSVILLGVVAWPSAGEPGWHKLAVAAGMALSVLGMFARYLSHLDDRRDIHEVERERTK